MIIGVVVLLGGLALFLYSRHDAEVQRKAFEASQDEMLRKQLKSADALEKKADEQMKHAAELRRRADELDPRGSQDADPQVTTSRKTKTQAMDDDSFVSDFVSTYPDLRYSLLRNTGFGDQFDVRVMQLVAAGKLDPSEAQHLRNFATKIRSLPD